jgi:hypothetical protein
MWKRLQVAYRQDSVDKTTQIICQYLVIIVLFDELYGIKWKAAASPIFNSTSGVQKVSASLRNSMNYHETT